MKSIQPHYPVVIMNNDASLQPACTCGWEGENKYADESEMATDFLVDWFVDHIMKLDSYKEATKDWELIN